MTLDMWRDLLRAVAREHMTGAGDNHEFGARQSRHEITTDAERADRIGIAPDQERWRLHLGETRREVALIPNEPVGRRGAIPSMLLTPVTGAEATHVDPACRPRENEVPNESGRVERGAESEDAAH